MKVYSGSKVIQIQEYNGNQKLLSDIHQIEEIWYASKIYIVDLDKCLGHFLNSDSQKSILDLLTLNGFANVFCNILADFFFWKFRCGSQGPTYTPSVFVQF